MKKILALVFDGFEEMEAIAPIDILRRAEFEVTVASTGSERKVLGRSKVELVAEIALDLQKNPEAKFLEFADFDALVIAGGGGVFDIVKIPALLSLVRNFYYKGALVAAICAAPVVLKSAGILDGKKCTAHFSVAGEFEKFDALSPVVVDGNVVTSQGAGTATDFALELVKILSDENRAKDIAKAICFTK